MKPAEYVEKIVAESFKREGDQEENVVRILPFFATALGVIATALIFIRPALSQCAPILRPFTLAVYLPLLKLPFTVGIYLALLVTLAMILVVLVFLSVAVWPRRFLVPMTDTALLAFADALMDFYTAPGGPPVGAGTIEQAIVDDLREAMTTQLAHAATRTRSNNFARLKARSRGLTALVFAIGFAFLSVTLIFVRDAFSGECDARSKSGSPSLTGTEQSLRSGGASGSETQGAGNARNDQGRLDLQGGSAADGPAGGATVTSEPATRPANSTTPAVPSDAPKPAPPPMQTTTKGVQPGNLRK